MAWLEREVDREADGADQMSGGVGMRDPIGESRGVYENANH